MNPYLLSNHGPLSFEFVTDQGVIYNATFFDYNTSLPGYPELAEAIYSFTLDIILEINDTPLRPDERLGETIVAIFMKFFNSRQNVVVYVCDSSDDRHLARKRKFDFWFWKYNDGTILKVDSLAVIEDMEIYNSVLVHKDNVNATRIIEGFYLLNEKAEEK